MGAWVVVCAVWGVWMELGAVLGLWIVLGADSSARMAIDAGVGCSWPRGGGGGMVVNVCVSLAAPLVAGTALMCGGIGSCCTLVPGALSSAGGEENDGGKRCVRVRTTVS